MPAYVIAARFGLLLSIAACALIVGTHSKGLISTDPDNALNEEPTSELGVESAESAWPHLRNDLTQ